MKNTLLILSEDRKHYGTYLKLFTDEGYDAIVISPGETADPDLIAGAFLVIVPDCAVDPTTHIAKLQLPVPLPILMLGKTPAPPPFLAMGRSDLLYDYLGGELLEPVLTERLRFLRKVATLSFERNSYLQHHENFLDWYSTRDGLTGLFNRHHFHRLLSEHFATARTDGLELSLLLLDLDYFHDINTACGRNFGDFVLNGLSARITSCTREKDYCFRLSGGEFAVLMPTTDLAVAREIAQELRVRCETKPFARNATERKVTLSTGVASLTVHHPLSADEFVNMAETALYKAKAEGRNRVYVYAPQEMGTIAYNQNNFDNLKLAIKRLFEKTRSSTISSLQLLARDTAGPSHREHLERVSSYIELLCDRLGLTPPIIRTLQNAATLHISLRRLLHNDLLTKSEKFSQKEVDIMQDFPYKLSKIIEIFDYFSQERMLLKTRSEKFDGSGYPDGLRGDEIPLGARIMSITDAFAAMEANRPHRACLSAESILLELKNEAGKQFDPFLVLKLMDIIEERGLLEVSAEKLAAIRTELNATLAQEMI